MQPVRLLRNLALRVEPVVLLLLFVYDLFLGACNDNVSAIPPDAYRGGEAKLEEVVVGIDIDMLLEVGSR